MEALKAQDEHKISELKARYKTEYPNQIEGIEVLFGLPEFLRTQADINKQKQEKSHHLSQPEVKQQFKNLTEYQFLMTHFILQNSNDKAFLSDFWNILEKIGGQMGNLRDVHTQRNGVLTQVAVYKILEQLGERPRLSHPDEDAFEAIDLWVAGEKGNTNQRMEL